MPIIGTPSTDGGSGGGGLSETGLLNDALGQIGQGVIGGIDDTSIQANYCRLFYPPLRDGLTRSFRWNWSLVRISLVPDPVPPLFEFAFSYQLPPDCLRVWEYNGTNTFTGTGNDLLNLFESSQGSRYKVEGKKILTNDGSVKLLYGARVTNPDLWDATFYQVVTTWLAGKLAMAISKDEKKAQALLAMASNVLLPLALSADGQESSIEPIQVDDIIWGRALA
jgi:hypothetical protein